MSEPRGTARRDGASRRLRARPRTGVVAGVVVALALGGYGWAATRSPGFPSNQLEPNDGTVWVTNDRVGLFGRLNAPAARLDAALAPGEDAAQTYQLDVVQSGSAVLARDRVTGRVTAVDVREGTLAPDRSVTVPATAPLAVGGATSAVVDPETGEVRAARSSTAGEAGVDGLSSRDDALASVPVAPDVTGEARAADVAVAEDGTVYAAGSGGGLVTLTPAADGGFTASTADLGGALQDVHVLLTAAGPVVLDTVTGVLAWPGGERTAVTGASILDGVPQGGVAGDSVLVATPRALVSVDLAGGVARTLADGGTGPAAEPVVLDSCTYAVWSGSPGRAVRVCGGGGAEQVPLENAAALLSPHLRLNHRSVVLNDAATGAVWSLESGRRLDDWTAVAPPSTRSRPTDTDASTTLDRSSKPPRARDDRVGARPGRTSVLHVLDNDSNPSGSVLSVTEVSDLPAATGTVDISPDGQTVQVTLEATAASAGFDYVVDDGRGNSSSAHVTVTVRGPTENGPPVLRPGYRAEVTSVANRGTLNVPVAGDWRDPDSDPVAVTAAHDGRTSVAVTSDGRLRYTAPGAAGPRTVEYTVSDGTAETTGRLSVDVLAADSVSTSAATPLPDIGRGEVGKPVVLRPLENDVPGTDPTSPAARLQLAGDVTAPDGATVETSIDAGTVSVTAGAPGTYLLAYAVRYGNAPFARGTIRVDVRAAAERSGSITAMLDQAVVHGQTATVVDVLANDVDPAGGLLVVQGTETESSDSVDVAVLRGRWVRIVATRPELRPNPVLVRYTVTNGSGQSATGDISVLQLPEPADDTPVTSDDTATVRSGDHVSVPVLDNDLDPSGSTLRLSPRVEGAPRGGTLPVSGPDGATGTDEVGAAYVAGSLVRYQAPRVSSQQTVTVTYVVENAAGRRATGTARVTVTPPPTQERPDRAPTPPALEGRVVAGDTITVTVAGSGADPDGDSTTLVGLASAPRFGRVLATTPSSITYQAYPTSGGTDDFTYLLGDRYGKVGEGTARIAVTPPGDPQPVVAVDDEVTVEPGSTVAVDVLANDIQPIGERASIRPLAALNPELDGRAVLDADSGALVVTAPSAGETLAVRYAIVGASGEESVGTVRVRAREGVNLPPSPRNALAQPAVGATSVEVDLLAGAVDPDDPGGALRVTRVFNASSARLAGGVATLPVTSDPQVLTFEVVDAGGAAALGVAYVPAGGSGAPSVRPDALVRVERDGSTVVDLDDIVLDPAGRDVTLTTSDRLAASPPGQLRVEAEGPSQLRVTALAGYVGPAAVSFEVTTAATREAAGRRAFLSVPVQVGPETPVLRCPPTAVDVVVGGQSRPLSVPELCHVWTADPDTVADLRFAGSLESPVAGLSVRTEDDATLVVTASSAAVPGSTARLVVTVEGTEAVPAVLTVRVAAAEPPSMAPVSVEGVRAGTTTTVSLEGYLRSQLGTPEYSVVGVERVSGSAAEVRREGPTTLSVTPSVQATGRIVFEVTITDVESTTRRDRQATGTLTVDVLGVPGAPGTPAQTGPTLSGSALLSWRPPPGTGLPVEGYEVAWEGGTQRCDASPCLVTGLRNAVEYRFTVRARNVVGFGPASAPSAPVVPDEVPGSPLAPRVVEPADGTVTVAWNAAPSGGSPVDRYLVTWPGGRAETGSTSVRAAGLDNTVTTPFTVTAHNEAGWGPPVTVEGQSAGTPATPAAPTLETAEVAGGARQAVLVRWVAVGANGPGDPTYRVTRTGPDGSVTVCRTTGTRCEAASVENDGSTYQYRVTAANEYYSSAPSEPVSRRAVGTPGAFTGVSATASGTDREVDLRFTAPPAHDDTLTVTCRVADTTCGTWSGADLDDVEAEVLVPANGAAYTLTLTATNSAGLSSSTQVSTDVVYGPLGPVQVHVDAVVGPYVTVTVTARPNGRSADVELVVSGGIGGPETESASTGPGVWSHTYPVKVGYARTLEISATVDDSSRHVETGPVAATTGEAVLTPDDDPARDGLQLRLTGSNLPPSATMRCVVTPTGGGEPTTVTFGTGSDGTIGDGGSVTVPTTVLLPVAGVTYDLECDDGQAPATPVQRSWTAP
ncbi:fibronectin type III domain-containing protein [Phycicoccus endophyticus]|uniref:Fibronectin type III domain-containing protein n=1 Tax=Phycicoccus endophyticus TaxID=1690220 RepID=A0A7G9QZF9_9MICO|nr:Ig-like domain-containing protein [Phycicoccus endophyticus]NHI19094.1 fibronectin type III domain-containing protein [Phycicoccus endophyticus]QNN48734.1 fibronectin type III domain-containing protein [Phycicoccus endophyticus]GGL32752.1 fibronectin type III [Phycicoccus endophyticus]